MSTRRAKKTHYSIREVSRITSLQAYVLRYWETEFPELRPRKNRSGNRAYSLEDIKLIFLIKKLLYREKYTIAGARQRLKAIRQASPQLSLSFDDLRSEDALYEIKKELENLLKLLPPRPAAAREGAAPLHETAAGAAPANVKPAMTNGDLPSPASSPSSEHTSN
ncbi:MAG: MerR family transcriptional regulator [candidate division KSB1 bacterium]|nr:MerR family transcriptional regulator [candidate division KSB1 bacterium]MDZ7272493.1 MerR family transcriptional regulator [candidate division KSB1 bacterium]MDZ7284483.1 MerR family transcriptional regulator [candidate division KSB1 bacterium]MDZ7297121.1 MerR family transcriptional regulator [candidate division KSB1 bacterium]MDZ7306569.1 MerR family transcriptional regulator [candidate division KSB1 bacterium]